MRLAINMLGAARGVTGVDRYTLEILPRLQQTAPPGSHILALVADRNLALPIEHAGGATVELVGIPSADRGALARHFASQVLIPSAMRRTGADCLFSPANVGTLAVRRQLVVIHDLSWIRYPQAFRASYRAVHRMLFAGYQRRHLHLAAGSAPVVEELRLACPTNTVHLLPYGPGKSAPARPRPAPAGVRSRVLWVGTLMERKDLPTALRATQEASRILGRRLTLTIAGDSGSVYSRPNLPSITGVDVEWAGRISDDQLEEHYRTSDLLLFTSYYEGLGFPCVEALARGLPVVATALEPLVRLHLKGIRFAPARDVSVFANEIASELQNPSASETGISQVSWDSCARAAWEALGQAAAR